MKSIFLFRISVVFTILATVSCSGLASATPSPAQSPVATATPTPTVASTPFPSPTFTPQPSPTPTSIGTPTPVTKPNSLTDDWGAFIVGLAGCLGSLIIGAGGLAVAIITVYLSHKERTSIYKEVLYTKQLEIYTEAMDTVAGIFFSVIDKRVEPDLKQRFNFAAKLLRWRIYLPDGVIKSLSSFHSAMEADSADYPSYVGQLGVCILDTVEEARKSLGVEPLDQEALKLFKTPP